jgi:hypothetical protein
VAAVALFVPGGSSGASVSTTFESSDGNLAHDTVTDWNDFAATGSVTNFDDLTTIPDAVGNPDDIFNGGVKQDKVCPGTKQGSLGGGDSKFDVLRLYLTHTKAADSNDYLFLAWERVPQNSTTASSHIAFEFNAGSDECTNGNGLLQRSAGDKLLVYDFEGGSAAPTLKLLTWITAAADGPCEVSSDAVPCWGQKVDLNGTNSDAQVNIASIGPVLDTNPTPDYTLGTVEFGEAGINLTAAVGEENVCDFSGHVTGVARSSGSSGTAQMKDKVGPAEFTLPGCVANTSLATNVSLDDHATITAFDSEGTGDHTGTLTFSLFGPDDPTCQGTPVYTTTISDVDSAGPWSTADGSNTDSSYVVPTSAEGVYRWTVHYSGDSANTSSDSLCGDESADVQYTTG